MMRPKMKTDPSTISKGKVLSLRILKAAREVDVAKKYESFLD